jgi:CRISPR-associated endoribonuclease Cas6
MILNELCFGVRLFRDITYEDSYPSISKFISNAFSTSIIEKKQFVFNNFYPVESDKIYKKNKIYWITLRSIDPNIKDILLNVYSDDFEVVNHNIKKLHTQRINRLYTITPVVITLKDGRFWTTKSLLSMV